MSRECTRGDGFGEPCDRRRRSSWLSHFSAAGTGRTGSYCEIGGAKLPIQHWMYCRINEQHTFQTFMRGKIQGSNRDKAVSCTFMMECVRFRWLLTCKFPLPGERMTCQNVILGYATLPKRSQACPEFSSPSRGILYCPHLSPTPVGTFNL